MINFIDFYANWCGPCQIMQPILEDLEKELKGKVIFKKIDVDQNQAEASKYGVLSIPTYILEKDGKEIERKIGAMSKEVLVNWIQSRFMN